ncbi:MAG: hypothetical protein QXT31_02030 [Candidatus Bathyarchaeia archaeon]
MSGQIIFETKNPNINVDYLLNSIKSLVKFRAQKFDNYFFYGGIISHFQFFKIDNEKTYVSLRFTKAKLKFLDNLIKAITSEVEKCKLNCTLKTKIDFESLKSYVKENSKWFGELKNSFSSKIKIKSDEISLVAYPEMKVLSFDCEFKKGNLFSRQKTPSQIVNELLKIGGLKS